MSPEQWAEPSSVDHLTDVYALGAILYNALTGRLPYNGETPGAIAFAVARHDPAPMPEVNDNGEMELIVRRAMARERAERYQSIKELATALEEYAKRHSLPVDPAVTPVTNPPPGMIPPADAVRAPAGNNAGTMRDGGISLDTVPDTPLARRPAVIIGMIVAFIVMAAATVRRRPMRRRPRRLRLLRRLSRVVRWAAARSR